MPWADVSSGSLAISDDYAGTLPPDDPLAARAEDVIN